MIECAICGEEIKKSIQYIAISKDRWSGKISEKPEDVVLCHSKCVTNALDIIRDIMTED